MARYFFDIHDGTELTKDEDGVVCGSLSDLSFQAIDVLPEIVREVLPGDPFCTFYVRVRDDAGRYVFRATLTFASAWIVETIDGEHQPGGDRWTTTLSRAKTQVAALRKEFAEDGYSQRLEALDSLFSVAQSEVNRLLATRAPQQSLHG